MNLLISKKYKQKINFLNYGRTLLAKKFHLTNKRGQWWREYGTYSKLEFPFQWINFFPFSTASLLRGSTNYFAVVMKNTSDMFEIFRVKSYLSKLWTVTAILKMILEVSQIVPNIWQAL